MPLINLIILIVVIGLIVWLINSFLPIDPRFKQLIVIIAVIIIVLMLLSLVLPIGDFRIGRLHG